MRDFTVYHVLMSAPEHRAKCVLFNFWINKVDAMCRAFSFRCWFLLIVGAFTVTSSFAQAGLQAGGRDAMQTFKDSQVVALVQAIEREDLPGIDLAIKRGANINAIGEEGQTPLHWSLLKVGIGLKTVKHLLDRGADPNAQMSGGKSPLFLTAGSNRPDLLELFLQNRGNPNVVSRSRRTPLMDAIASQYEVNVRLLLKYGADPNLGRACAATAANSRFDFTVLLLQAGLSQDIRHCANLIRMNVIPEDSPQQAWRAKVFELLAERGVVPPFAEK